MGKKFPYSNCHIEIATSFTHKELTPGGKNRHVKHVSNLNKNDPSHELLRFSW